MRFEGTVAINAPRDQVFAFLTNPEGVSQCVPGLESIEVVEPGKRFRATAAIGFGTVKARFVTDVEWLELEAPSHARMKARGKAPGSVADVESSMTLSEAGERGTSLAWAAEVTVAGTIASVAVRLMGTVSQKLTGLFFECVRGKIEGGKTA
jgi:carbon monoxide dehydrogenase subunit G